MHQIKFIVTTAGTYSTCTVNLARDLCPLIEFREVDTYYHCPRHRGRSAEAYQIN